MSVKPARIAPLTYAEFITAILLPQVSILLIQADCDLQYQAAYDIWLASGEYSYLYAMDDEDNASQPNAPPFLGACIKEEYTEDTASAAHKADQWYVKTSQITDGSIRECYVLE